MRFYVLYGLALWLVGTVALRLAGQYLFGTPVAFVTFAATTALYLVAQRLYAVRRLAPEHRPLAALSLVLPGMLLDIVSLTFVRSILPNIPDAQVPVLSGWLLWANGIALVSGVVPVRVPSTLRSRPAA